MKRSTILALAAGTLTGVATAQNVEFHRVAFDDINDFRDTSGTNQLLVGSTIFSLAFDGTDIYLAGFNGSADPWVQIGHVVDVFAGGPNRAGLFNPLDPLDVNTSSRRTPPGSRGYTGLDWMPGAGLLAVIDTGASAAGSVITYDTETQQTPILDGVSTPVRGLGAVSWDPGPDGNGYDVDGDTISDGPQPALLLQPVDPKGPLGVVRPTLSTALGDAIYAPVPGPGELQGPILEFAPNTTDRAGLGGTFWRGFDFSPDGRYIVAVADGDLVIAERDLMNFVFNRIVVQSSPGTPGDAPFIVGQQCTFVDNYDGQDFVVMNRRLTTAAGQAFTNNVRLYSTAGTQISYALFDETGIPLALPAGAGLYDFAWHEPSQTLAILDTGTHIVHFFRPNPPAQRLCADQNQDGLVSPADFSAWIANFNTMNPLADVNQDTLVSPADFSAWIAAFNQGLAGPTCNP